MTAPGNAFSIFRITGADSGEKLRLGSSRTSTSHVCMDSYKSNSLAFCPPDSSRIGRSISSAVYFILPR